MTKTPDYSAILKDTMGVIPVDTKAIENAIKTQAVLNEKLSGLALTAAEKSTEISTRWTKDTLAKMAEITKVKSDPADYAKAMTEFATAQAEASSEYMAAFAEVAKQMQMQTVELMLSAGKDAADEMTEAAKKAQTVMAAGVKNPKSKPL